MKQDKEVIIDRIEACLDNRKKLSKWESDFIDSIYIWFERNGFITDKQEETLERIYANKR
jgi:hypothetical protein